ncbi:LysR family transcriptional regulator [Roseovarius indicus]|uniref:HTH-type transcriptional regulator GltR n=1 Tax=Roseovarius indicus TaxID=540747 RepID=A0A5P3A9F1_9RHOB|nr:LysR family transcriptional regulator [Roseovarius indicus]OAN98208.1 hypothetical protein A8B76_19665 [Roseovarius indicus]QEW25343.1 HTH-type transcriptional regulator GltR [Roseovarius indicus]SFE21134.1 transcriptional regulator, LysR family [Roseovarius indicus]
MNIELARTFLEVVSTGSMSRAADRLNVTHSTVTVRIKTLEDILRRRVLNRNRSGISLTADGVRFQRHAEDLVRIWQMTRKQMSLASGFAGLLSMGAESSLWQDIMLRWASDMRHNRPDVALRCESGTNEFLVDRLFSGWLDFCVVHEVQSRSGFSIEPLFDDPIVTVSTRRRETMPWDPEFVEVDWGASITRQSEMRWGEIDETPKVSASDQWIALKIIEEFGGSTVIPQRLLNAGLISRPLYPIDGEPALERKAYLMYSEKSLKERVPKLTPKDIKSAILACSKM